MMQMREKAPLPARVISAQDLHKKSSFSSMAWVST
jgi:hypothetical protein